MRRNGSMWNGTWTPTVINATMNDLSGRTGLGHSRICAFAKNMPYDQFVTWQLAGDLFAAPTAAQIVATACNRLHSHKQEGVSRWKSFA